MFAERTRKLPQTDPYDRQITIGLGCFAEVARLAAAEMGIRLEIRWLPQGQHPSVLDRRPIFSTELHQQQ